MIQPKSWLIPNYSIILLLAVMVVVAAILNLIYVPDNETLFRIGYYQEFTLVFILTLAWLFIYSSFFPKWKQPVIDIRYTCGAFVLLYLIGCLFAGMKSLIHVIQPYSLDEIFISIEQFIHFGYLPTNLINRLLPYSGLYHVFDYIYWLWFIFIYVYVSVIIFSNPYSHMRERYLFCFGAVWFVVGSIAAILMASVGPIYLSEYFTGQGSDALESVRASADMFVAHARDIGLMTPGFRDMLLEFTRDGYVVDSNAPSAMPSVHVAMAALMMFHAYGVHRLLFAFMTVFFTCILAGSVLLSWHYAIDGYLGSLLTYGLWKISAFLPAPKRPETTA